MSSFFPEKDSAGNVIIRTEYTSSYMRQTDAISKQWTSNPCVIDFKIENHAGESFANKFLWGGEIYVKDGAVGDYATLQIVDVDNLLGYGAGLVLKEYVKKKFIVPGLWHQGTDSCPGKIPVGVYLRCNYYHVGSNEPLILINYDIYTRDGE